MSETINSNYDKLEPLLDKAECLDKAEKNEYFISKIHISKIKHLHDIDIPLSDIERKHLVLTGKNGSGKTSVLEMLAPYLESFVNGFMANNITCISSLKSSLEITNIPVPMRTPWQPSIDDYNDELRKFGYFNLDVDFSETENLIKLYDAGKFILAYFSVARTGKMLQPQSPDKTFQIEEKKYSIKSTNGADKESASNKFIQYLVNLETDRSFAISKHAIDKDSMVQKIDDWFNNFESRLRKIFDDDSLKIDFDYNNYVFYLSSNKSEKFPLNELSSGYSAIINIIAELIMRMEYHKSNINAYDVEGVVLIDEIETHLHVTLQKEILPILIDMFPKIQFIVTTHSPFVLTSIDNAVIYDLEKQTLVEDLSNYPWSSIVEGYFDTQEDSDLNHDKLLAYEDLKSRQDSLTSEEELELATLYNDLFPKALSKLRTLQLKYGL